MLYEAAIHGGDVHGISKKLNTEISELLDFSTNVNPLGVPDAVMKAMYKSLDKVSSYPDFLCRDLCSAIADRYGVLPENIVCGNGAADIIYRIVQTLKPKEALLAEPGFAEYREALTQNSTHIKTYNMIKNLQIEKDIIDEMSDDVDIMFLCNPNNPTGLVTDITLLKKIMDRAVRHDITVVIDECFMDFVKARESFSMIPEISRYHNMIILKSFTKIYSIPGIRLGYAICKDTGLAEKIRHTGQTWPVNSIAEAAGIAALSEDKFTNDTIEYIEKERKILSDGLKSFGFKVWDGKADYLLFEAKGYPDLYSKLLKYKIIIRSCENYTDLTSEYFRIAVKSHEENEKLLSALKEITE